METFQNYLSQIPRFPIISLDRFLSVNQLSGKLYACLAYGGSTGTIKSPLAYGMIALALEQGVLRPKQPIWEASSGTFGAALTIAGQHLGHTVTLCVSSVTSMERIQYLQQLGANIKVLETNNPTELLQQSKLMAQEHDGYFIDCFNNDLNPEFHRRVTGPTILKATKSDLDFIVAGVGSGGTITGVGEYAKAWSNISMVAVEPYESQVLQGGFWGKHTIKGIGLPFIAENYNPYVVNRIISVTSGEAHFAAQQLALTEGIPACSSAGATIQAGCHLLKEKPNCKVLCILAGIQLYK